VRAGCSILAENYDRAAWRFGPGQQALLAALSAYNTGNSSDGFRNGYIQRYFSGRTLSEPCKLTPISFASETLPSAEFTGLSLSATRSLSAGASGAGGTATEQIPEKLPEASDDHPYLVRKGVASYDLRVNEYGDLVVPLRDVDGKIWSLQRIKETGEKPYEKDARKEGCFHVIGGEEGFQVRGLDTVKRQIQMALGRDKQQQLRREKTEERTIDTERRPEEIQKSAALGL
jgi:hypothetical protein